VWTHHARLALAGLFIILAGLASSPTRAQAYPERPVRVVSPYPPGSSADFVSRIYSPKLSEALGQQFIVDNRPGAAGNIGAETVARAAPDGYTLLTAPAALATSRSLYKKINFDLVRDFDAVSMLSSSPHILAVCANLPVKNVKELLALAKARPGQLTFASSGTGSSPHLTMELFRLQTGIDMVHVPYKGSALAVPDVISGQVDMLFSSSIAILPHARSGRLRALGITSSQRNPTIPDLPTIAEAGVPGFESSSWSAMLVPARTPRPVLMRLNATLASIAGSPDMKERAAAQGATLLTSSPEQARAFIKSEVEKWARVIAAAGIRME